MLTELLDVIDRFSQARILVLGDFLLDQFLYGEISRVSREAPVLILRYQETRRAPGGGANTVANVESLGARAIPLGFLGQDETARQLLSSWPARMERRHVFQEARFQTTRKVRILAGSFHSFRQQVVRIDHEYPLELQKEDEERLIRSFSQLISEVDAVILSDYSLGTLNTRVREAALELARQHRKIVVADSRDHPQLYRGATSMTPNITEVKSLLPTPEHDLARLQAPMLELRRQWGLEALLVTRGKLGMSLCLKDSVIHIPVFGTDEVADVTGAGDTVTATYTTALAASASFEQAARLANYAGGLVVMKKGTATISQTELRQAVQGKG